MAESNRFGFIFLGVCLLLGLTVLGYLLGNAVIRFKEYERVVTVKGLSEREVEADIVIWPIQFAVASNHLGDLYNAIEENTGKIKKFLEGAGIKETEMTVSSPVLTDKSALQYSNQRSVEFRYTASQTVTVYTENISAARDIMERMSDLGKQGIVFTGANYASQTEYIFSSLNEIKPEMIDEATRKAREVAEKFAANSKSTLGKIKTARQGQFSIRNRDKNNPHIKKVRVVSTVSYYLSD